MSKRMEVLKGALMLAGILFLLSNFPILIILAIVIILIKALKLV